MKRLLTLVILLSALLFGCGPAVSPQAIGDPSGEASKSAPAVLLEQPDKARDAAAAANKRAKEAQQALPQ